MENANNQPMDNHEQPTATAPQVSQAAKHDKRIVAGIQLIVGLVVIIVLLVIFGGSGKRINLAQGVSLDMVKIEAGSFTMGDAGGDRSETPHRVTITKDYYLGKTEVTQAQWRAVMGNNPSEFKGDNLPVDSVSWDDAIEFCDKLNRMGKAPKGYKFTLPTEAQWEYAARGGKKSRGHKYSGSDDVGDVAWYSGNSGDRTHTVAMKKPNELGLYDMSGNVWEWCLDWHGEYPGDAVDPQGPSSVGWFSGRVMRGSSWYGYANDCRSTQRGGSIAPGSGFDTQGFRLALVPVQ